MMRKLCCIKVDDTFQKDSGYAYNFLKIKWAIFDRVISEFKGSELYNVM